MTPVVPVAPVVMEVGQDSSQLVTLPSPSPEISQETNGLSLVVTTSNSEEQEDEEVEDAIVPTIAATVSTFVPPSPLGESQQRDILSCLYAPNNTRDNKLRIKLIISETSRNVIEKNLKKIVSPFFSLTMGNYADFGMFHIALGIGPW